MTQLRKDNKTGVKGVYESQGFFFAFICGDYIGRFKSLETAKIARQEAEKRPCYTMGLVRKDNTSGITGVCFNKKLKKYQAYIYKNGKKISLGFFVNKNDAIAARRAAE